MNTPLEPNDGIDAGAADEGDHVGNDPVGNHPHENQKPDDKDVHPADAIQDRFQT